MESDSGFNAMDMAVAMGHRNGTYKYKYIHVVFYICVGRMLEQ